MSQSSSANGATDSHQRTLSEGIVPIAGTLIVSATQSFLLRDARVGSKRPRQIFYESVLLE